MFLNSLFRVSYGVGALLTPSQMAKLRLTADTAEHPEARLFVRGFGAHQVAVAALGLASRRWRGMQRDEAAPRVYFDDALEGMAGDRYGPRALCRDRGGTGRFGSCAAAERSSGSTKGARSA